MDAVILCNGDFPRSAYPRHLLRSAGLVVCCDGALRTFLRHSERIYGKRRMPDVVIGDLDSLSPAWLARLREEFPDTPVIRVEEQDYNDLTKAWRWLLARHPEVERLTILGATGKREDHTLGNLSLLMEYARHGIPPLPGTTLPDPLPETAMVSDHGTAFAVTDSCELGLGAGRRISLFSPDNSLKLHADGLEWPTDAVVFDNWWKATLNRTVSDRVKLTFNHPSAVLVMVE